MDCASDEPYAFVDAPEAQPDGRTFARNEPDAIVHDPHLDASVDGRQLDQNRARAGVAGRVGQRFLRDPKKAERDIRIELARVRLGQ